MAKNPPLPMQETQMQFRFLGWEGALEEEMLTRFSILA